MKPTNLDECLLEHDAHECCDCDQFGFCEFDWQEEYDDEGDDE
jgi:hypothetical protein